MIVFVHKHFQVQSLMCLLSLILCPFPSIPACTHLSSEEKEDRNILHHHSFLHLPHPHTQTYRCVLSTLVNGGWHNCSAVIYLIFTSAYTITMQVSFTHTHAYNPAHEDTHLQIALERLFRFVSFLFPLQKTPTAKLMTTFGFGIVLASNLEIKWLNIFGFSTV